MNETTTMELAKTTTASIVPTEHGNLELSAQNPAEMVQCQNAAIEWCRRKIDTMHSEAKELKAAFEHAKQHKWSNATLKRHWELAEKRTTFYRKILAALQAGYYIVPNFPVTLFAIRTEKPTPKRMWARLKAEYQKNFEQDPQVLPVGQGEYRNPQPVVKQSNYGRDEKGNETWDFHATDWAEMEFPANMARLHVMDAATQAMDAKIFDEIGFLPQDYKRNPDPLLIGHIIDPRPVGYGSPKYVSFMIAWHLDTKTL